MNRSFATISPEGGRSTDWAAFYRELDPGKRKELLAACSGDASEDGTERFRKQLFQARHTDPKRPEHEVDLMLFMCVNFIQLYKSARLFRKGARRDVLASFSQLQCDQAAAFGDAGQEALYLEFRNAAARYFKTCESPGYNRRFFGLAASGEENRRERMCRDAWQMSEGLARRVGLNEEMTQWNRAVSDALAATGEDAEASFRALREKMS